MKHFYILKTCEISFLRNKFVLIRDNLKLQFAFRACVVICSKLHMTDAHSAFIIHRIRFYCEVKEEVILIMFIVKTSSEKYGAD